MRNRKEEILTVALHLFARDGYEAVSVSQIAGELDMTKGALYRHYKSKRDIFDCIVERMEQGDSEQAAEYDMPEDDKESMPDQYKTVSLEEFFEYSKSMFAYWTEDDFASSFRKMLTIEQFRSEEMQNLYQQYLVSGPAEYVKDLFKNMEIKNPKEKIDELVKTFKLEEVLNQKAKTLSGGWQRKVSIATALINNPQILFLDEPTLGLDVIARRELWSIIESQKRKITIILTTHYMEEAESLSDRVGIMAKGSLIDVGTPKELIEKSNAKDFEDAFVKIATGGEL